MAYYDKGMSKSEAKLELKMLSHGTLGTLTGKSRYVELDDILYSKLDQIDLVDVSQCKNWQDVWEALR